MKIEEANRSQLLGKSKASQKGKERFDKRNRSHIKKSTREFNSIDMNKLFKDDILTFNVPIQGETDNYIVKISFGGLLDILQDEIKRNNDTLSIKLIIKALLLCFNRDDVYVMCDCPDSKYRMKYWQTRNNIISGSPENIPSKITNPNDTLGSGCKHVLLALSNTSYLIKIASVINNYIHYMETHYERLYADIIYPKLYGKKYDKSVQLNLDEPDKLAGEEDTEIIDTSNKYGATRTQFKKDNKQGIRFASSDKESDKQIPLENEE